MTKSAFVIKFSASLSEAEIEAIAATLKYLIVQTIKEKAIKADPEGVDLIEELYKKAHKEVTGKEPDLLELNIISDDSQKAN